MSFTPTNMYCNPLRIVSGYKNTSMQKLEYVCTQMNAGGTKTQQRKHRYLIEELLIHNADILAM